MKSGLAIPGFKLVLSRVGNRYWKNPAKAAKLLLAKTILREDEVYSRTVLSPAGVEKLLGKSGMTTELANLVGKPQGQPVIAPEDDKRESCLASAESEFTRLDAPTITMEDF